ncbi:MAG: YbgC/FadM family acyl-CoA thioesterase [candidate division Zixibacteria bacterium]|nr:YbgC/FadM family acyl-CoA thioesterase [candidate division Zixibacteria bacterium]
MKEAKIPDISEYRFKDSFRVRYHHCDPHKIVHHSNYLRFMENARVEYWRQFGLSYRDFETTGMMFVVADSYCKYISSAKFDDNIDLYTRTTNIKKIVLQMDYLMKRRDDNETILYGAITLVNVDYNTRRPVRIPESVVRAIKEFEENGTAAEIDPLKLIKTRS